MCMRVITSMQLWCFIRNTCHTIVRVVTGTSLKIYAVMQTRRGYMKGLPMVLCSGRIDYRNGHRLELPSSIVVFDATVHSRLFFRALNAMVRNDSTTAHNHCVD
jgi:hypothetical protein